MAAGYLRLAVTPRDLTALHGWLCRFAETTKNLAPPLAALSTLPWDDLPARVNQSASLLSPEIAPCFRLYVRHFLARELPSTDNIPPRQVRVHFPTFNDLNHSAGIYELKLILWEGGEPILLGDPDCAFLPVAGDFLDVVKRGFARYQKHFYGPVSWSARKVFSTTSPEATNTHVRTLSGRSPTLAVCIAFRALAESAVVDPGCLMSAQFQSDKENPDVWDRAWNVDNPDLFGVNGERQKAEAGSQYGHLTRFLMSDRSEFGNGQEYTTADGKSIALVHLKNFDEAYLEATGLVEEFRKYLRFAAGLLDEVTPRYFHPRTPSELYVEPEVFKGDVKLRFDAADETEELRRYYTRQVTTTRAKWKDEWPNLTHAVVIGYPGDGKSVLARKVVSDQARQGLAQLERGACPATQLPLPIFIRLEDVGEKSLEAAMRHLLPKETDEAVKCHLEKALCSEQTWVILDGLDEVKPNQIGEVTKQLDRLARGKSRVIITSRPYGYRRANLPFPQVTEYQLAPLNEVQQRSFITKWFSISSSSGRRQVVERLVQANASVAERLDQANASVAEMARNALLLSLICSVSETKDLDPTTTRRPQVYKAIVDQLYQADWKETGTEYKHLGFHIRVLREVAWRLFQENPAGWSFDSTD
jgi:hypothetical protein